MMYEPKKSFDDGIPLYTPPVEEETLFVYFLTALILIAITPVILYIVVAGSIRWLKIKLLYRGDWMAYDRDRLKWKRADSYHKEGQNKPE